MNNFKNLLVALFSIALFSCSNSDDTIIPPITDEITQSKLKEIVNDTHIVELYTNTGILEQGYNAVSLRIKDKKTNSYVTNASINWTPLMHMSMMQHGCPTSDIKKTPGSTSIYNGFIIFQMAGNDTEYWELTIQYTIDGVHYEVTDQLSVIASKKRTVNVFTGTDNKKYVIALISPSVPKVATNEITIGLFEMENTTSFPVVENYTIHIDPRMPSMGNHSSPNNVNPVYLQDQLYHGSLSLTMSGYWKINLKVLNQAQEVLKGENITAENESSSLFFEIEF